MSYCQSKKLNQLSSIGSKKREVLSFVICTLSQKNQESAPKNPLFLFRCFFASCFPLPLKGAPDFHYKSYSSALKSVTIEFLDSAIFHFCPLKISDKGNQTRLIIPYKKYLLGLMISHPSYIYSPFQSQNLNKSLTCKLNKFKTVTTVPLSLAQKSMCLSSQKSY